MLRDVAKHSFSPSELRKELRSDDFWKYSILAGSSKSIDDLMIKISNRLAKRSYTVENLKVVPRANDKYLYIVEDLENNLLIRRTNTILKQFVNQAIFDRNEEIKLLCSIISSEPSALIFRTDVSGFFESINFNNIINIISADGFNNLPSLKALKSIMQFTNSQNYYGLPRGISVSATLADYFMKKFDSEIYLIETCFYYTRYVDDIIIALTDEGIDVKTSVINLLPEYLNLNHNKTEIKEIGKFGWLEYLGYSIDLSNGENIQISERKINKTKTRICMSVAAFNKNLNFDLLMKRLTFLACNTRMSMSGRERPVIAGFKFSYPLCSPEAVLKQMQLLDRFFHGIINSKTYKPSIRLRQKLSSGQLKKLNNISFFHGYDKTIMTKLTRPEIAKVKQVWKYEQN